MTELMEVIDDNLNVLRIAPREEIMEKNLKHKGAIVIVKDSKNRFYLHQRKHTKKIYPLKWGIGAGGGVKAGESSYEAAKRELNEELGIEKDIKFLMNFSYKCNIDDYIAKIYIVVYDGKIKLDEEECEQGKWVSLDELKQFIQEGLLCPDTELFIKKYLKELIKK